ncbi:MAG TPA: hypothetical protein VNL70_02410 [Tepidisphaeraceae bacterium]|nr:hypothetical protein [Tepidisphaeraceae bacterium]
MQQRIQDDAGKLKPADLEDCIREAIAGGYAKARPLTKVKDFAGDDVTYDFTLDAATFPGWIASASYIRRLEYPAGERVPVYLDADDWEIVRVSTTVQKLRLLHQTPQSGKTLRVEYTVPHAEDGSTVPEQDFYGCVNLAASLACRRLAAIYNQLGDSAIGADVVDHKTKADRYRTLARDLEAEFEKAFGLSDERKQSAGTGWRTWDEPGGGGEERLTH